MSFSRYLLVLSATDSEESPQLFQYFQKECMFRAVGLLRSDDRYIKLHQSVYPQIIRDGEMALAICRWIGVDCDGNHAVRAIIWESEFALVSVKLDHLLLEWLPATVETLNIKMQRIDSLPPFHTRQLPRCSMHIAIKHNLFPGSFETLSLPNHIVRCDMSYNRLSGEVFVGALPNSLKKLNLTFNLIDAVYVDNVTLPENLECVKLSNRRKVPAFEVSGKKIDKRIVSKRNIDLL